MTAEQSARFEALFGFAPFPPVASDCVESVSNGTSGHRLETYSSAHAAFQSIKGKRIPDWVPSDRSGFRAPYPVADWVGDQFSRSSTAPAEKSQGGDRKKLRGARRVARSATLRPNPVVHVRRYQKASWLTSAGASQKRRLIERKGLPSFKNWRFITLTIDRERFPCPLEAYLHGVGHLRRFLESCRKNKLWKRGVKWAWKLEFHADLEGYPHWHLLVGHRFKFTHRQLSKLSELWAMGRTKVQRVEDSAFGYSFKYAFKPVLLESQPGEDDEFERLAPDWFLHYVGKKTITVKPSEGEDFEPYQAEKTVTFKRVRFWQTSKGFYTSPPESSRPPKAQKTWSVAVTVREDLEASGRTVQIVARSWSGRYQASSCVVLNISLEKFWGLVGFDVMHGRAVGLGVFSYVIPADRITTNQKTKWLINPILEQNRLTLRQAEKLRNQGETLRTC